MVIRWIMEYIIKPGAGLESEQLARHWAGGSMEIKIYRRLRNRLQVNSTSEQEAACQAWMHPSDESISVRVKAHSTHRSGSA